MILTQGYNADINMKVLLINYEYPPLGGGTGIANQYLVKEFKKLPNLTLDVLTSSIGSFQNRRLSRNTRLVRLDIGKNLHNLHHQSYLNLLRFFWHITWWTFKHKNDYDLIHAFSGLPGGVTAWLSGRPYIVSFRGAEEPGYEPRHDLLLKLVKPLLNLVYRRARHLDVNSQFLKQLVLKSFPELKITVINNGVDRKKFYPAKNPVTQPVILCTSRFGARKGLEYLIRALPLVPQAKLLLAGTGTLEKKIKFLVKNLHLTKRVKFLGPKSHQQLPSIYRRAKIFVLPSLSESQSNSLLEALASGLPVVATNIGGNPELINSQNGILVPPADSQALAEAIIQALNRRWQKISLGQKFSWKHSAKEYWRLYSQYSFSGHDTA